MSWLDRLLKRPVRRVTIHHEGGGRPRNVDLSKYGYTASVFPTGTRVFRTPWQSWATRHHNHVSYDIVLTGDRGRYELTDDDIARVAALVHNGQIHGEITADFELHPHGTLNPPPAGYPTGSDPTECPGIETIGRWAELDAAVHRTLNVPPEEDMASYPSRTKPINIFRGAVVDLANKHVTLANSAVCKPAPTINNPNPWVTSYSGGPGKFTIVTGDWDEYHFDLP